MSVPTQSVRQSEASLQAVLVGDAGIPWAQLPCAGGRLHLRANRWEIDAIRTTLASATVHDPRAMFRRIAALGFAFAAVYERPGELWGAVDHVRAHPLMYRCRDDGAILTDDPYRAVAAALPLDDECAIADFQLAGYATGSGTLAREWRGLRPGECIAFRYSGGRIERRIEAYAPRPSEPMFDPSELAGAEAQLRALCDRIFDELCGGLGERQIVVPLSSGIDSQYIVAMLKRRGCRNVIAFSYGLEGNAEALGSRATAERLGIPWHFIAYSRERWRQWYASAEMRAYLPFCARHVSTPHLQDWPAVQALKAQGLLQPDAVFVPGHTAILTSANRLHHGALAASVGHRRGQAACLLYRYHFDLRTAAGAGARREDVLERIAALLPEQAEATPHELLNAFYDFEASERHAKLVVNSVRVYEYFGYAWAIPLWDRRIRDFWARVPYEHRFGKQLFRRAVHGAGLYDLFGSVKPPSGYARWRRRVKENPVTFVPLKHLKCLWLKFAAYFVDRIGWNGIVTYRRFLAHRGKCGSIYSILSCLYLQGLSERAIEPGRGEPPRRVTRPTVEREPVRT